MKRLLSSLAILSILCGVVACGMIPTGEDKVFSVGDTGLSLTAPDVWQDITSLKEGDHELLLTRVDLALQIQAESAAQQLGEETLAAHFEEICTYMPVANEAYTQIREIDTLMGNGLTVYRALFSAEDADEDMYSFLYMIHVPDTDHLLTVAASGSPSAILEAEDELSDILLSLTL